MANRRVVVEFLGEDRGLGAASGKAEAGAQKLDSSLKGLGKTIAAVYVAKKAIDFGKAAVEAAIEDAAAQERLGKTLKNVTQATDAQISSVEKQISAWQDMYGIADDKLRPAFEILVRKTKDVAEATMLMNTAMDISRGTGKELTDVSDALVKAMGGQTRALKQLGIDVKDAGGAALSFDEILQQLNTTFGGQAASFADTQAGKMEILKVRYQEFQETIGNAVLPVLGQLIDIISPIVSWFNNLDSGTQKAIIAMVGLGVALYTGMKAFTAISTTVKAFAAEMTVLQGAMLGVGAVIGVAILAYSVYAGRKAAAVKTTKDLAAALKEEGDNQKAAIGELIRNNDKVKRMAETLQAFGYTWQDLGDYVQGKATPAFTEFMDKVKGTLDSTKGNLNELYHVAKDDLGWIWEGEKPRTLNGLDEASTELLANLREVVDESGNLRAEWDKDQVAADLLAGTTKETATAVEDVGSAAEQAAPPSADLALIFSKDMTNAMDSAAKKTAEMNQAVIDLANTVAAQVDKSFAYENAINSLEDAVASWYEAQVKANKSNKPEDIEAASRKYLELRESYWSVAQAAGDLAVANSGATDELTKTKVKNDAMIQSLVDMADTLAPGSPLRKQLSEWIEMLRKIPNSITTTIDIKTSQAVGDVLFGSQWNHKAVGGDAIGPTVVGEDGPELVNFRKHVNVATAQRTKRIMSQDSGTGGQTVINVYPQGPIVTFDKLVDSIHEALLRKQRVSGVLGLT